MKVKTIMAAALLIIVSLSNVFAEVRVHCDADKERATQILEEIVEFPTQGERIIAAARALTGTPVGYSALHDSVVSAMVSLHELSPLDFASTVLAFAKAATVSKRPSYQDFADAFVSISRRRGEDGGFASRLLYSADWTVDNIYRGNLTELTERLPDNVFRTRSFDHYTTHRSDYEALRDSAEWEKVRMVEMGYRSHKIPYMKKQTIGKKEVKEKVSNGDVIILLAKESGGDIYDIGFVEVDEAGEMRLIHADPAKGEVVADKVNAERFFKTDGQYFMGYRLLHPSF